MQLAQPHRIARVNYAPRVLAFGYIFLVVAASISERGALTWLTAACAIAQFLVYPHLAYLHTRIAADSKRAEINNLLADALMLGAWAAQTQFALWLTCGLLIGPCINNATNGGIAGAGRALALFVAGALVWGAVLGFQFHPDSDPYVSGLCIAGIIGYVTSIGILSHAQNARLLRARDALRKSEEQFRFIAEHAGDLVAVLDQFRLIRYASASHSRYFKPGSCAPGQSWLDLVHKEDRDQARHLLDRIASANSRERVHLRMLSMSGAHHLMECQGNAVWDDTQADPDEARQMLDWIGSATTRERVQQRMLSASGTYQVQMIVLILRDIDARVRADVEQQLSSGSPVTPGATESGDGSVPSAWPG